MRPYSSNYFRGGYIAFRGMILFYNGGWLRVKLRHELPLFYRGFNGDL